MDFSQMVVCVKVMGGMAIHVHERTHACTIRTHPLSVGIEHQMLVEHQKKISGVIDFFSTVETDCDKPQMENNSCFSYHA